MTASWKSNIASASALLCKPRPISACTHRAKTCCNFFVRSINMNAPCLHSIININHYGFLLRQIHLCHLSCPFFQAVGNVGVPIFKRDGEGGFSFLVAGVELRACIQQGDDHCPVTCAYVLNERRAATGCAMSVFPDHLRPFSHPQTRRCRCPSRWRCPRGCQKNPPAV